MIRMKKRTKKLNSQQFQSDDLIFGDNNNNGDGGGGGGGVGKIAVFHSQDFFFFDIPFYFNRYFIHNL